jgi:hypothetical protein
MISLPGNKKIGFHRTSREDAKNQESDYVIFRSIWLNTLLDCR